MTSTAQIGRRFRIKGTVTADEPLTIAGTVDGKIEMKGHPLTITPDGTVNADVSADTILIDGEANGSLTAGARIVVRNTAIITGEIHAPVLSVAEGAQIRGRVDAGSRRKQQAA